MAEFRYSGRQAVLGSKVTGVCRGRDAATVAQWLHGQGILVVDIQPIVRTALPWPFVLRPAQDELSFFTRQMVALCKAGVPLVRGVQGLADSAISPLMKRVLMDVLLELQSGHDLAASLAVHPQVFDSLFVKMVRMGEETGRLEESFQRLHDFLFHQRLVRQRFVDAIRYPAMVVLAMIFAVLVIGIWVIPAFAQIFATFGASLPWITRGMLSFSHFLLNNGPWLVLAVGVGVMGVVFALSTKGGRRWWHLFLLRLPLIGSLLRQMVLSRVARGLAMGFASGLTVVKTLAMVAESVDHPLVEKAVATMAMQVDRGAAISTAARESGLFTPVALQMMIIGEESGQLDTMLEQTADYYDQESRHAIATLQSYLEPVLTLFVALLVLLLAMGVFLPMWDLGHAALRHG